MGRTLQIIFFENKLRGPSSCRKTLESHEDNLSCRSQDRFGVSGFVPLSDPSLLESFYTGGKVHILPDKTSLICCRNEELVVVELTSGRIVKRMSGVHNSASR